MLNRWLTFVQHTNDSDNTFWFFANVGFIESIHLESLFGGSGFGKSIKVLNQMLMVSSYTG